MTEASHTPERVLVFDTTLRDGAQSPGIALSHTESLTIARQLAALGVDVIEAGFPSSSEANFDAVQAIARQIEGPVIAGLARAVPGDIDRAAEAVRDAINPRIHTFVSTSDIHIEHQMGNTREDVKGLARAAVAQAKGLVDDVEFSPMDATRSDIEFTAEVVEIAIAEGATTINIPDTVGYTQPEEYKTFLQKLYRLAPNLGGVVLSVHCHDDLGLAVANSFAGIQAGARQVECAVNGLGERAGNASLEEIVMLLRTRRETDGFDTGIDASLLVPTSKMVSSFTGYGVQPNKAIVGRNAFSHESGIHQAGVIKNRSTFEIMHAEHVGADPERQIVLGKQSGRAAVAEVLQSKGEVFDPAYLKSTFDLFKNLADQVGEVTHEQIVELHFEDQRRQAHGYKVDNIKVQNQGNQFSASAQIIKDGVEMIGLNRPGDNSDGTTAAIFSALAAATRTNYTVSSFNLDAVGEGQQTIGRATVILRLNGKSVIGQGLSLDTNKASALAYLDAIAKAEAYKASA